MQACSARPGLYARVVFVLSYYYHKSDQHTFDSKLIGRNCFSLSVIDDCLSAHINARARAQRDSIGILDELNIAFTHNTLCKVWSCTL